MLDSVILRKKGCVDGPVFTALPMQADLNAYDIVDEHGNVQSQYVVDEIRNAQQNVRTRNNVAAPQPVVARNDPRPEKAAEETRRPTAELRREQKSGKQVVRRRAA